MEVLGKHILCPLDEILQRHPCSDLFVRKLRISGEMIIHSI